MSTWFDRRNDEQRAAIHEILQELPPDHPARAAYRAGADPITLTHLVGRDDLAEKLQEVWVDWYTHRLRQQRAAR
jgi:hypothetical protein